MNVRNLPALQGYPQQVKTGGDQYGNPLDLISWGKKFLRTLAIPGASPKESLHMLHPQA